MEAARVYRRRRLGAALFVAVVAGALYAGSRAGAEPLPERHNVVPGDTLWSISIAHYPPSEDPRVIVEEIRRANDLAGYRIHPGTRLELPPVDDGWG